MEIEAHYSPVAVAGWGVAELRAELRVHGDSVVRRAAVALLAVVLVGGTWAHQQAVAVTALAAEADAQRRAAQVAQIALDGLTNDHARLIDATDHVPVVSDGAWTRRFVVTQYLPRSPDYGRFNDGFTATMVKADPAARIVAVDPTLIPYGSSVWIEGLGWFSAQDCGGAIKGNRLDVLTATSSEAFAFGRQERFVIVVPSKRGV
jgi:3D (Asp-Asp-Asp) domain-containing protein